MIPKLPYDAFLRSVKQDADIEHVFLLGAGASISSGIQSAIDCIWEWKRDIFVSKNPNFANHFRDFTTNETRITLQEWIDKEGCYLPANHPDEYSSYAEKAYPIDEIRKKYFENLCKGKEPSIGYKILCFMAQAGMVRVVFTTNFDGLIVKAAHQGGITPIEITLDTTDRINRPSSRNEILCIELHGDYKYGQLKNTSKELDTQHEDFIRTLTHHLTDKHLIVLGYSGRDRSLMEGLNKAYKSKGAGILFWCGYNSEMSLEVERLLKEINELGRKAFFIPTKGFDETLIDLGKYCFEGNENIQQKLKQALLIPDINLGKGQSDGDVKVNSLAEEIDSIKNKESVAILSKNIVEKTFAAVTQTNNWHPHSPELAITNIVGSWNEYSEPDKTIISELSGLKYSDWIQKIRDVLQQPANPLVLKNGIWSVKNRKKLWQTLGTRIFDDNLDVFKKCVVTVLTERDPKFELPKEDRFAASMYGKVLKYSNQLRKGLAESLSLLGCYSTALTNCSLKKAEGVTILAVREIFNDADWVLWASLGDLLPLIAEAEPDEFLKVVENALQQTPCPFDNIFAQEGSGVAGWNYLSGLLWSLETLAWEETFLVRIFVILGELAGRDPGGNWANRPSNSLTTILLPWHPQTIATIEKRKIAVQTLEKELPDVAWKLLLSLLPNQHQMSAGTHKPVWRNSIPIEWTGKVSNKEYWEQVSFYAEFAVEKAKDNVDRLNALISKLNNLPQPAFDKLLTYLSSDCITKKPEDTRVCLWSGLVEFTAKHKRFSDAKWALDSCLIAKIDAVARKLEPRSPLNLYARLFNGRGLNLYEKNGDWQEQQKQVEERRQQALKLILDDGGIDAVISFLNRVDSPSNVGNSLGGIADDSIDAKFLPAYLDSNEKCLQQFTGAYVWSRYCHNGWDWVDNTVVKEWSKSQIAHFYTFLPFTLDTWQRVSSILSDSESLYWKQTGVNPYQSDCELNFAVDKLIEYGRPHAAIDCIYKGIHDKKPLDIPRIVHALISAISSPEPPQSMDAYHIVEIIKALQDNSTTTSDDLFRVEWAYLPLLDGHYDATPKYLENRLATDSTFFCEVIRLVYRSKYTPKTEQEPTEQEKAIATNAWRLLHEWHTPPGIQADGYFDGEHFEKWLKETWKACSETGHLEVALSHIGKVLIYCPADPHSLWINKAAAEVLNRKDAEKMRDGFCLAIFNSRGVHTIDPTGKPERELAQKYRQQASKTENAGFQRLAASMKGLADSYDREADRIIDEHKSEGEP